MVSSRRAWAYLLVWLMAVAIAAVAAAPARPSVRSVRLTHRVDVTVHRSLTCRAQLGRKWPVRRVYARKSLAWRQGALRVWQRRLARCLPEARRVGVPPWFRRVMMCVHPKESADWHLNGHHEGGLQFAHSTWVAAHGLRFAPHAYEATPNEQIRAAYDLTHGSAAGLRWHWKATISGCL
jgi:hypothetical protein